MSFNTGPAVKALQAWYKPDLYGLYHDDPPLPSLLKDVAPIASLLGWGDIVEQYQETAGWWTSANAVSALIDYMATTGDRSYLGVLDNTFSKGQNAYTITGWKVVPPEIDVLKYTNFLNRYYDDEGWWALTWIKAYDLKQDPKYLNMAETIFQDMTGGWDDTFGGGIYWAKDHKNFDGKISPYKNAIANELFMAVAARLYLRTKNASYKTWAVKEANWFKQCGLINDTNLSNFGGVFSCDRGNPGAPNLIYDSLNAQGLPDRTKTFWTFTCGVVLHALCDLSIITGDTSNLVLAQSIADAAMTYFVYSYNAENYALTSNFQNGILTELSPNTSFDTPTFKGVLIRNLAALFANNHNQNCSTFITNNASSVLSHGNASSQFGTRWNSPPDSGVDFIRQSAAIDALNAGNRVIIAATPLSLTKTLALVGLKPPVGLREVISWLTPSVRAWATAFTT
jgi:predicted alpha-1,6-mannanase (GH76 family)